MKIVNKKVSYDYEILDRFEAGVRLMGAEVKSIRGGHAKLEGAFVRIVGSEVYLVGAEIYPYPYARPEGYDTKRTRKLLLHKKQIISLKNTLAGANLTLVPLSWYTRGPHIKLEVALAKGKREYQKREKKRREDQKRELEREFRGKVT